MTIKLQLVTIETLCPNGPHSRFAKVKKGK